MRLAYNLNRAFSDITFRNIFQPPALMLDVLNLEFQQRGQFAGEHPVTLLVAVLHGLYRFVVGHFTDDKGHFLQPRQFTAVGTAMARYNFIAVSIFLRAGKTGNHYTVYADRSNDFLHLRIVPYLKGVRTECVKRMNLGKFQINQLAFLNRAGRCSRLGSRLFHSSSFLQCRILCGLNGLLGIRGLSIASGHFVSFGRLGLVRGRLIRLGWAALAGPSRFLRFLIFSRSLFRFRRTATARLFRFLRIGGLRCFSGGCRLWRFEGFRLFDFGAGVLPLFRHKFIDFVKGHNHIAGLRYGRPGLFLLGLRRCGLFGCGDRLGGLRGNILRRASIQFFIGHLRSSFSLKLHKFER